MEFDNSLCWTKTIQIDRMMMKYSFSQIQAEVEGVPKVPTSYKIIVNFNKRDAIFSVYFYISENHNCLGGKFICNEFHILTF